MYRIHLIHPVYYYVSSNGFGPLNYPYYSKKVSKSTLGVLLEYVWIKCNATRHGLVCTWSWKFTPQRRTTQILPWWEIAAVSDTRYLEGVVEMLKKKSKDKPKVKGLYSWDDPDMRKRLPSLYDHIAQIGYSDKEPRKTSTLKVFTQDGKVKVFINDYNEEESMCVSADSWEGLWKALEAVLGDPDAEWRDLPDWEKKKKK